MGFKHFRWQLTFRLLAFAIMVALLAVVLLRTNFIAVPLCLALVVAFQIVELIYFQERTNRFLTSFLQAIRYSEFSRSLEVEGLGSSFDDLRQAFDQVMDEFQLLRQQRDEQAYFLNCVVDHVDIGLVAFSSEGRVGLLNQAACRIFGVDTAECLDELETRRPELASALRRLSPGERMPLKTSETGEVQQFVLLASNMNYAGQNQTLVSLQDIRIEMEEQELESWHKLIRVLTHEIMNSITPITSLAATATSLLDSNESPESLRNDLHQAIQTIHRRSRSLLDFVESYRHLTGIRKPQPTTFAVRELLDTVTTLMQPSLEATDIEFTQQIVPPELTLFSDSGMLEQVLINLLKNAVEALADIPNGRIHLEVERPAPGRVVLRVVDNGVGIDPDSIDKIFVPFYTTKKTGSGIGLSVARQMVRALGGTLSVQRHTNAGSVFQMILPQIGNHDE